MSTISRDSTITRYTITRDDSTYVLSFIIYEQLILISKLSGSVGIGVSAGGGSFGASIGWGHIQSYTESGLNIFTQSEAQCCAYTADMYDFIMPPFHKNFIAGLGTLTEEYHPSVYRR